MKFVPNVEHGGIKMGCGWRMVIHAGDIPEGVDTKPLWELLSGIDDSGAEWDEWTEIYFNASYGFSVKAWAEANKDVLKKYPGLCLDLFCDERDPDESFEVEEGWK